MEQLFETSLFKWILLVVTIAIEFFVLIVFLMKAFSTKAALALVPTSSGSKNKVAQTVEGNDMMDMFFTNEEPVQPHNDSAQSYKELVTDVAEVNIENAEEIIERLTPSTTIVPAAPKSILSDLELDEDGEDDTDDWMAQLDAGEEEDL